ncbi:MAG: hypothetical protein LBS21_11505, partial [Clostridiales bacterium]|nr:hypothetical protein [Clostridiales bacterium]MDR1689223.1 hypothetical protein [Clostridiales bacterium]
MNSKSGSYHIDIQTHRKNPCGFIRTSFREDGKVKHKTIATLSGLTIEQLRSMQAALQNKAIPKA